VCQVRFQTHLWILEQFLFWSTSNGGCNLHGLNPHSTQSNVASNCFCPQWSSWQACRFLLPTAHSVKHACLWGKHSLRWKHTHSQTLSVQSLLSVGRPDRRVVEFLRIGWQFRTYRSLIIVTKTLDHPGIRDKLLIWQSQNICGVIFWPIIVNLGICYIWSWKRWKMALAWCLEK
jgi:hypothetical protein